MSYVNVQVQSQKYRKIYYGKRITDLKLEPGHHKILEWHEDEHFKTKAQERLPLPEFGEYKLTLYVCVGKKSAQTTLQLESLCPRLSSDSSSWESGRETQKFTWTCIRFFTAEPDYVRFSVDNKSVVGSSTYSHNCTVLVVELC